MIAASAAGGARCALNHEAAAPAAAHAGNRRRSSVVSPHRIFRDDSARLWNAWDVIPIWGERRLSERRTHATAAAEGERRRRDRRLTRGIRIALPPRLASGWLAFECGEERRRIAPIPPEWHLLPDEELRALWRRAELLPPRRKGLVE
jgi:hypothetical protein